MLGRLGFDLAALSLASLLTGAQAPAPSTTEAVVHRVDRTQLMADARSSLGSVSGTPHRHAGRPQGTRLIRDAFAAIGLKPAGPNGFAEPFAFTYQEDHAQGSSGRPVTTECKDAANVLGSIPGTNGGARSIVVSAHYDHLGVQGDRIYHGADDNASGVAALLAAARWFAAHPLRHAMLFAAFDAEELGLKGAQTFVASGSSRSRRSRST